MYNKITKKTAHESNLLCCQKVTAWFMCND